MRTYGAGVEMRDEKNATYTIHLEVLEGVSSETPTTCLLILLPAYIFMRGGGGGWERSTMGEEGLAWVSYYRINYPLVFIGCSVCFFSVSLDTLVLLGELRRKWEAKTKRKRQRERYYIEIRPEIHGASRNIRSWRRPVNRVRSAFSQHDSLNLIEYKIILKNNTSLTYRSYI